MRRICLQCLFFLILFSCKPLAYRDYIEGVSLSDGLNYSEGINSFLKSWELSPMPESARGLAQAYYKTRNFEQAEEWYGRLNRDGDLDSLDLKPFAEVLIANSKYAEAEEILTQLDPNQTNAELSFLWQTAKEGRDLLNQPNDAQVSSLKEINSTFSEFGPFLSTQNELWFTSDRIGDTKKRVDSKNALKSNVYGWTGNGYLSMYSASWKKEEKEISGTPQKEEQFASNLHVGPYFQSGENVFLTLTQAQKFDKSGEGKARNYTLFPEVFFALDSDSLTMEDFSPLDFNNAFAYSVADPFYDAGNSRLYFSSDMPGGQGRADIYYVTYSQDQGWSSPINLGSDINTSEDERTPFIDQNGDLLFSSAGYPGIGGLDVFKAEKSGSSFSNPENLGSPVNSNRDDFGFFLVDGKWEEAFIASDRTGGMGLDDIYWVDLNVQKELVVKGKVLDKDTKMELSDAVVDLKSSDGDVLASYVTKLDGQFRFEVELGQTLSMTGRKTGYLDGSVSINLPLDPSDSVFYQDIFLDQIQVGKTYTLENIYYDFDRWEIREDAKPELDKLVQILKDNPTIEIELYSHTDSRGSDSYNLKLSDKRAKAAVDYLLIMGISGNRMKAIGYGETKLLNQCSNGVECSEEQHQLNRRTEFKITHY